MKKAIIKTQISQLQAGKQIEADLNLSSLMSDEEVSMWKKMMPVELHTFFDIIVAVTRKAVEASRAEHRAFTKKAVEEEVARDLAIEKDYASFHEILKSGQVETERNA